jgi:hypothetical protein
MPELYNMVYLRHILKARGIAVRVQESGASFILFTFYCELGRQAKASTSVSWAAKCTTRVLVSKRSIVIWNSD